MKKYIVRTTATAVTVFCMLLLASCGSKKAATRPGYESSAEQTQTTKDPLKGAFSSLANSYKPWKDVSLPVKLELKEPKRFSISGKASMVHDKSVNISLRILGMELGAIYVDQDSIYIVSKMQRMAYVESLDFFSRNFGFTLEDIQSLLLGQAFVPGKGTLTLSEERNFRLQQGENADEWIFTPAQTPRNVSWHFEGRNPQAEEGLGAILQALIVNPSAMKPLSAIFGEHTDTSAGIVASEVNLSATMSKRSLKLNIIWNFDRAEWNKGISSAAPKISSSYNRLTTKGLLELLKKL